MAGAMSGVLAVTGFLDHAAGDVVHFGAMDPFAFADVLADELSRGVARVADDVEDANEFLRDGVADVTRPGLIGANRAVLLQFADDIEEDEVAALDRRS